MNSHTTKNLLDWYSEGFITCEQFSAISQLIESALADSSNTKDEDFYARLVQDLKKSQDDLRQTSFDIPVFSFDRLEEVQKRSIVMDALDTVIEWYGS